MRNPWEDDEDPIGPDPRDPDMGWDDRDPPQEDIPDSYFEAFERLTDAEKDDL